MERGDIRVLEGVVELRIRPLGLQVEWLVLLCGGCGWLMPSLGHEWHQNCKGVDSHVGFLSIIFVSLVNLQRVQQFGSNI